MIAFVSGTVADIGENSIVIDTGNIGYEVFMNARDLTRHVRAGAKIKVYTYFQVREDAMLLYGFLNKDDLSVFKLLLGVNGVGPKGALGVLSGLTADELRFAVLSDDLKTLSKAPGVGKKTAQKMILELKDKLNLEDAFEGQMGEASVPEEIVEMDAAGDTALARKEAAQALIALGYASAEAMRAVKKVPDQEAVSTESILSAALRYL